MQQPDVLPAGTLLRRGAYRIESLLGRGGFGITYRAVHVALDRRVAIKEFFPRQFASRAHASANVVPIEQYQQDFKDSLRRFTREGRILDSVENRNVVSVRDLFEEHDTAYLVMELLAGRTLREELLATPNNPLPVDRIRHFVGSIVSALNTIHEREVFHLDIKPENVMIAASDRVVLLDFGAARQGFSTLSKQAYTPAYAPVEVITGGDVGPESDLYELGVMLHEFLTGTKPPQALLRLNAVASSQPDPWSPIGISQPWSNLLTSALALKKEDRPKSVHEWWSALGAYEDWLSNTSTVSSKPSGTSVNVRESLNGNPSEQKPTESASPLSAPPSEPSNIHQHAELWSLSRSGFNLPSRLKALGVRRLEDLTREQANALIIEARRAAAEHKSRDARLPREPKLEGPGARNIDTLTTEEAFALLRDEYEIPREHDEEPPTDFMDEPPMAPSGDDRSNVHQHVQLRSLAEHGAKNLIATRLSELGLGSIHELTREQAKQLIIEGREIVRSGIEDQLPPRRINEDTMAAEMAHSMYLTPEAPPRRASMPVSLSEAILRERLNSTMMATLWGAMETTEPVSILYRHDDNQISAHVIWPERIWVMEDDHVAVHGYDSRSGAVRTFRADRIADAHIIEP